MYTFLSIHCALKKIPSALALLSIHLSVRNVQSVYEKYLCGLGEGGGGGGEIDRGYRYSGLITDASSVLDPSLIVITILLHVPVLLSYQLQQPGGLMTLNLEPMLAELRHNPIFPPYHHQSNNL